MGRGASGINGNSSGATTPTSITQFAFRDMSKLLPQVQSLPMGTLIKRVDDDGTVVTSKKVSDNSWDVTTATSDDSWSITDTYDDYNLALVLQAGFSLGSNLMMK